MSDLFHPLHLTECACCLQDFFLPGWIQELPLPLVNRPSEEGPIWCILTEMSDVHDTFVTYQKAVHNDVLLPTVDHGNFLKDKVRRQAPAVTFMLGL